MRRLMLALGLLFCALALGGNSSTEPVMAQGKPTSLRGHVYGILTIPAEEMAKMPEELKNKRVGKERIVNFKDGSREVRVGIVEVSVSIGRKKVLTDEDGNFYLSGLSQGRKYVTLSFGKEKFLQQYFNNIYDQQYSLSRNNQYPKNRICAVVDGYHFRWHWGVKF